VQALAHGAGAAEYSYPALAWADQSLWVSYTDQRQSIAWQRFSLSAGTP
jgi:predicted neuraminidase